MSASQKVDQEPGHSLLTGTLVGWGVLAAKEFLKTKALEPAKKTAIAIGEKFRRGDIISPERGEEFRYYINVQSEQEKYFRLKREVTQLALEKKIDPLMLIRVMEHQQDESDLSGRECALLSEVQTLINEEKK